MDNTELENKADLILCNARVITLDAEQPYAELIAVKGNRILAVGGKDDLDLFKGARTKLIDCEGGTVIPGFNDAHCHPLSFSISLLSVDCSPKAVKNIAEIQTCIRRRAEQTKEGQWIRAAHYDESNLQEGRPPNRWELDEASPRHPVVLFHKTAGNCVLNSLALRLAGITKDAPESSGGQIHRDPESGEPSGLISGRNERVMRAIPPVNGAELEKGMKLASREYLSQGITSLQDTSWNNRHRHWLMWQRLMDRGVVSTRVSMMIGTESLEEFQNAGLSMGAGNHRLRLGGIKLALDESTGQPHPPQESINHFALRAQEAGFQVAFHVSDVHTLEASLAAIKFVCQQAPKVDPRFRLEHCAVCPPGLLPKLKASQALVITQPSFVYYMGQKYHELLLPHQTEWLWPIGSFRRWGVKVAFSSDSPLVTSNPLTGIYASITRKTELGHQLAPQESVSTLEALKMYTLWGAYASFEEGEKGSISRGKLADLVVLSGAPTQLAPEQLFRLRVLRTIVDGELVWEN